MVGIVDEAVLCARFVALRKCNVVNETEVLYLYTILAKPLPWTYPNIPTPQ